jgi:hypothetical protein
MDSPMISGNCEEEDILVAEEMSRGMRSNMSPPSYADVVSAPLPYQVSALSIIIITIIVVWVPYLVSAFSIIIIIINMLMPLK